MFTSANIFEQVEKEDLRSLLKTLRKSNNREVSDKSFHRMCSLFKVLLFIVVRPLHLKLDEDAFTFAKKMKALSTYKAPEEDKNRKTVVKHVRKTFWLLQEIVATPRLSASLRSPTSKE